MKHSKTLERLASTDKRVSDYYIEEGTLDNVAHVLALADGWHYEDCITINAASVKSALEQLACVEPVGG